MREGRHDDSLIPAHIPFIISVRDSRDGDILYYGKSAQTRSFWNVKNTIKIPDHMQSSWTQEMTKTFKRGQYANDLLSWSNYA